MLTVSRNLVSVENNSTRLFHHTKSDKQTADHYFKPVTKADSLLMKVSDCRTEREHALHLVQKVYSRAGLSNENLSRLRVLPQHLDDDTEIIVGKRHGHVTFTATLVGDGKYGLPLESLFEDEVTSMRAKRLRLGEASCLAHDKDFCDERERFDAFVQGISFLLQVARDRKIDRLLLVVHPRHAKFYERLLGCVRCSGVREYAAVGGNPAVLCMHDFAKLDQIRYPLYNRIYNPHYEEWQMNRSPMSAAEKQYFEQFLPAGDYEYIPMAG